MRRNLGLVTKRKRREEKGTRQENTEGKIWLRYKMHQSEGEKNGETRKSEKRKQGRTPKSDSVV